MQPINVAEPRGESERAPPKVAELPDSVLSVTVSVPEKNEMPPPTQLAELFDSVLLVIVAGLVESMVMPPPLSEGCRTGCCH